MKSILLSSLLFISFAATSQTWCDTGANWKYSYSNGSGTEGYTEIQYVRDTNISGQISQVFNKHIYAYDFVLSQLVDFDLGQEYTYENNGVVFLWYNNSWDTLYNFNATVGEGWRMAKQPMTNACDSNSLLTVTARGTKIINSITLNYLVVDFSFPFGYSDTIVEKIGFINSYMLPYDGCDGALDINEGGAFRCYEDNNFMTYKPHYTSDCHFLVGIKELDSKLQFKIVPNPACTKLELSGVGNQEIVIIRDLQGKEWHISRYRNIIDLDELPCGLYILSVVNDYGVSNHRFIKQ